MMSQFCDVGANPTKGYLIKYTSEIVMLNNINEIFHIFISSKENINYWTTGVLSYSFCLNNNKKETYLYGNYKIGEKKKDYKMENYF